MCYEESLFRPWAKKKALRRETESSFGEQDRARVTPIRAEPAPDSKRKEVERESEEIL
jgi:hypothetical protein